MKDTPEPSAEAWRMTKEELLEMERSSVRKLSFTAGMSALVVLVTAGFGFVRKGNFSANEVWIWLGMLAIGALLAIVQFGMIRRSRIKIKAIAKSDATHFEFRLDGKDFAPVKND